MGDRYGSARSPQPMRGHTCKVRRNLHKGWEATGQDECPGCAIEREEGWAQLLESFRSGLFVYVNAHRE